MTKVAALQICNDVDTIFIYDIISWVYIYIFIYYIYIHIMDCVCQRYQEECSTRTCADDCYDCWKNDLSLDFFQQLYIYIYIRNTGHGISWLSPYPRLSATMVWCDFVVSPLLTHSRYYSLELSHKYHDSGTTWKHFPHCWPFVGESTGNRWIIS